MKAFEIDGKKSFQSVCVIMASISTGLSCGSSLYRVEITHPKVIALAKIHPWSQISEQSPDVIAILASKALGGVARLQQQDWCWYCEPTYNKQTAIISNIQNNLT